MRRAQRKLRFGTLDEALAEAERLVAAEKAGKLAKRGSWTLGQALGHLAAWNSFAYDGYPSELKLAWPVKLVIRLMRGKMLRDGIRPGTHIPGIKGGTVGTALISTDEGLSRFRGSIERVRSTPPVHPSPAMGSLSHEQFVLLVLRHAELHLGFQEAM